jgi:flagellar M-ring protein FliF
MESLAAIRRQIAEFFSKMERGQIIRLGVLLALIIAISITAVVLLNHKTYSPLPVSGDAEKMGEVDARLAELNVQRKIGTDGTIMVPEDQVAEITWQLAADGIFSDDFDYGWMKQGTGFSSTESMQEAYTTIQWQENLRKMINGLDKIQDSKVLLKIEEESPFVYSGTKRESTASVLVYLIDPENPLTAQEANVVRQIVRFGVNIKDENITVADNMFNYYDVNALEEEEELDIQDRLAYKYAFQDNLARSLTKLLEPVFGVGNVDVMVAAEFNFDKQTEQSVIFEPPVEGMETGLPIAIRELSETIRGGEEAVQGEPGLDENGGAPSYVEETIQEDGTIYEKVEREVNMEINEIKTLTERTVGDPESLSIAASIPLDENMEDLTETVRNILSGAAGVETDVVVVERMPRLAEDEGATAVFAEIEEQAQRYQTIRFIVIAAAIVLVIVLLLIALRTVLKALKPVPEVITEVAATEEGVDLEIGEGGLDDVGQPEEHSPLSQLQRFIDRDPEAVAQLLRNWLTDDYR